MLSRGERLPEALVLRRVRPIAGGASAAAGKQGREVEIAIGLSAAAVAAEHCAWFS